MAHKRLFCTLFALSFGCTADGDPDRLEPFDVAGTPPAGPEELVDEPGTVLEDGGYGILLLDTTSSMNTTRPSTGNTRCADAKTMAAAYINDFFDPNRINGDGLAIWGFTNNPQSNDDVQPATTGYYTDAASAIAAVNTYSCQGDTPLADAMCKSFNGDGETFTLDPLPDQVFILTDGFEDNSDGPCSGPSGDVDTPGTWQYKVMAEMISAGLKVDTRYWINPDLLLSPETIDSFASEPFDPWTEELLIVADIEELPPETIDRLMSESKDPSAALPGEEPSLGESCDTSCNELGLFEKMAVVSGGSWGVVEDDDTDYPNTESVDPETGPKHPTTEPDPSAGLAPS